MNPVHLGYEVGSGRPIAIPVRHLAVTGQTQESGKTTTLEALINRSGLRAVAFVTKRAEGSFQTARTIPPYFRERADWQFVSAVLEATLRERLKFERSWIMRACKGAKSLADVQRNIKAALPKAKGLSADIYMTLDEYLNLVIPQVERLPYSNSLMLEPGLNVIDLEAYTTELQALVIRSVIEWIYQKERETVVVIPEAWKFIPQKRSSPVLLALEHLIREGAAAKNYVWLDSQDIAGVHKEILRSVPVWIIGVQREANEVKRALAHIPGGSPKPSISDVMQLSQGQFFVSFGKTNIKVYVQPAWMDREEARGVAVGERILLPSRILEKERKEKAVTEKEAQELREENLKLRQTIHKLEDQITKMTRPALITTSVLSDSIPSSTIPDDFETLFQNIKRRLIEEAPTILKVLDGKPEVQVEIQREVVTVDGNSPEGWIARLIVDGFFDNVTNGNSTYNELRRRGARLGVASSYDWCRRMVRKGFLTEESKGSFLVVPGMKMNILEK